MTEIFRSIPSFKIDQNWSRCSCISSACRFCPENMKKPSKSAFFRFFDYKIFISYQDGPKCKKWPTWPLVVCGVCRAYVVFISNTLSLRHLTLKWSCSQILRDKAKTSMKTKIACFQLKVLCILPLKSKPWNVILMLRFVCHNCGGSELNAGFHTSYFTWS